MRCLKVPRLFLPRGGFETWAVPSADSHSSDQEFWERVAKTVGNAPSCLDFSGREGKIGEEIRGAMYDALEEEQLERLGRGFVLVARERKQGTRYGILAAVDLEKYSFDPSQPAAVRVTVPPTEHAKELAALRKEAILEFPHVALYYRDKKNKAVRWLLGEDFEKIYDFRLMEHGGRIKGYYVPEEDAYMIADEIAPRGEPAFAVADGHDEIAAAKMHWEALKPTLKGKELKTHPARFLLAELWNLCDEAVPFEPVHRAAAGVDAEDFCAFFSRRVKCKRDGDILNVSPSAQKCAAEVDAAVREYLAGRDGKLLFLHGEKAFREAKRAGTVRLRMNMDREDLFPALKGGLARETFCLGGEEEGRYCLEGRELSYD